MHPLLGALLVAGERRRRWWSWCWWPPYWGPAAWAGALALAVSVASFAPEAAFMWALTGGGGCPTGKVRVPLDGGGDHDHGVPFVEFIQICFIPSSCTMFFG
jgi:hypothetical protein